MVSTIGDMAPSYSLVIAFRRNGRVGKMSDTKVWQKLNVNRWREADELLRSPRSRRECGAGVQQAGAVLTTVVPAEQQLARRQQRPHLGGS